LQKIYRGKPLGLVSFAGDFAAENRLGRPVISFVRKGILPDRVRLEFAVIPSASAGLGDGRAIAALDAVLRAGPC
jgi:hypothetical protein